MSEGDILMMLTSPNADRAVTAELAWTEEKISEEKIELHPVYREHVEVGHDRLKLM